MPRLLRAHSPALSKPPAVQQPAPLPQGDPAPVAGQWEARLDFDRGSANHTLIFEQQGNKLEGTHRGEFTFGDLRGAIAQNLIRFRSSQKIQGTRLFTISPELLMATRWPATSRSASMARRAGLRSATSIETPEGVIRPVKKA